MKASLSCPGGQYSAWFGLTEDGKYILIFFVYLFSCYNNLTNTQSRHINLATLTNPYIYLDKCSAGQDMTMIENVLLDHFCNMYFLKLVIYITADTILISDDGICTPAIFVVSPVAVSHNVVLRMSLVVRPVEIVLIPHLPWSFLDIFLLLLHIQEHCADHCQRYDDNNCDNCCTDDRNIWCIWFFAVAVVTGVGRGSFEHSVGGNMCCSIMCQRLSP